MLIIDLAEVDQQGRRQAAQILFEGFMKNWPEAWPTLEDALKEVDEFLQEGRICRLALNEHGDVIGMIGGISEYDGLAWELHPLGVHPSFQKQGVGSRLVDDFEQQVAARGGITIFLGSDDENNMTSLGGVDLYPDVLARLSEIRNIKGHPFEFYQKKGFAIVGVIPDANGFGKPDILMAKRVATL